LNLQNEVNVGYRFESGTVVVEKAESHNMRFTHQTIRFGGIATAALLIITSAAQAAGWGTIKGRFVVDGAVPAPAPLNASAEPFCVDHKPVDKSVIVGADNGLANAVVYLRAGRGGKLEAHPDYANTATQPVTLDNNGCEFHPHVTLVRTTQPLAIKNSDPVGHNTKIDLKKNASFNQTIPAGSTIEFKAPKAEALPMPVNCSIHPFMQGHVLVLDHPYMVTSAEDGTFEIKNVPAGKHEFQFWHEAPGYLKTLKFKGGATNRQGRVDLTVADGKTLDLGDIKVPAAMLK
jgi:hypothetical protein